jgi:hypothetical protein
LFLAVHGIGDQTAYETIQAVALRISAHTGRPVATPLGRFYLNQPGSRISDPPEPTPQLMTTSDSSALDGIGLAEAYWAPIPRQVASQKFVLEETKRWARSVAGRVAYRGNDTAHHWKADQVEQLVVVLDEMIETIRILQRLTFLADKAGLFSFDLGQLLVDFVGDVQLVADFQVFREKIIARFDQTVTQTLGLVENDGGHLYIVAHSEGTVVTFIALLEALADPDRYPWIKNVRGLMTIGSPIETHHLLWPSLWKDRDLSPSPALGDVDIPWENYMDFGDPIAYELKETKSWLDKPRQRAGRDVAEFSKHLRLTSHAFSRYPFPGKAHVDYWADKKIFDHFFGKVVGPLPWKEAPNIQTEPAADASAATDKVSNMKKLTQAAKKAARRAANTAGGYSKAALNYATGTTGDVPSRAMVPIIAFVLPYFLVAALLFTGVYLLEQAVSNAFGDAFAKQFSVLRITRDVFGIGALMFGVTVASRIPRVSSVTRWKTVGWGLFVLSVLLFVLATSGETQSVMGKPLLTLLGLDGAGCIIGSLPWKIGCREHGIGYAGIAVAGLAGAIAILSSMSARKFPRRGHYVLPAFGLMTAFTVVAIIWGDAAKKTEAEISLGGVVLALFAFFYLWWLSALLFDLVFIWQRYTRHSGLTAHLSGRH